MAAWAVSARRALFNLTMIGGLTWPAALAQAELAGHGGFVKAVAVSADGRQALSASFDYSLILWDLEAQREVRSLVDHEGGVNAVAFLPDGRQAISGSDEERPS